MEVVNIVLGEYKTLSNYQRTEFGRRKIANNEFKSKGNVTN